MNGDLKRLDVLGAEDLALVTEKQRMHQEDWRNAPSEGYSVVCAGVDIFMMPGVFPPSSDTEFLNRNLAVVPGSRVLDVGTGSGVLSVLAALKGASACLALDINPDAISNAEMNARRHGMEDCIRCKVSDGLSGLDKTDSFDLVLANLPGRSGDAHDLTSAAQWDVGFRTNLRFFEDVRAHLAENGRILMTKANYPEINEVISHACGLGFSLRILDTLPPPPDDPRTYHVLEFSLSELS